jgi:Domain of unknown function (DUF4917)
MTSAKKVKADKPMSFQEALGLVEGGKPAHVLLGNGFSRACRDDIFAYGALFDRANFESLSPHARLAFDALGTTDFEVVMRVLRQAAILIELYSAESPDLADRLRLDANGLREVLVSTIASSHPERPGDIDAESYAACKRFLSCFARIFTLNYDLLLYWALMQSEIAPDVRCDDGFRKPDDPSAEYVTWEPENSYDQNVYYLHGALHLFDAGSEIQKYTWVNTGVPLIEQVRNALENNLYPLFVAEGESEKKLERIRHSDFLSKAQRSLLGIGGALFTYGLSLAPSDAHILRLIVKSKVRQLFVGIFGDPDQLSNREIIVRAKALASQRPQTKPLSVHFYEAATARAWG